MYLHIPTCRLRHLHMITEIKYQGKFKSARVNQSYFLADIENGLEWPPRELQDKVSKCSWGSEATAWTSALAHKQPSWVRRLRRTLDLDDNMGTLTQASGHWLSWSSHVSGPSIPAKVPGSTLILLLPREPPSFKWPLNQGNCCIQKHGCRTPRPDREASSLYQGVF